jgi:dTDP-4-amino-4,6-dideoxygalactose transaminase
MFYIVLNDLSTRGKLIDYLKSAVIWSVFHYISLNKSSFCNDGKSLENSDKFTDRLLRLPMYYDLESKDVDLICDKIKQFFTEKSL